jgi:hypothetical protein
MDGIRRGGYERWWRGEVTVVVTRHMTGAPMVYYWCKINVLGERWQNQPGNVPSTVQNSYLSKMKCLSSGWWEMTKLASNTKVSTK